MSPLEKKDRRLGEGERIGKKKVSTRTMIKKAVRGGKIDFHHRSKEKTFIDLPKLQPRPFIFLNGSSLIPPHVTESGIWEKLRVKSGILGFGVRSKAQRIRTPTSN